MKIPSDADADYGTGAEAETKPDIEVYADAHDGTGAEAETEPDTEVYVDADEGTGAEDETEPATEVYANAEEEPCYQLTLIRMQGLVLKVESEARGLYYFQKLSFL